jgi:hypothetical protein
MRPAVVKLVEKGRQVERPVGREVDKRSHSFRFVLACGGHVHCLTPSAKSAAV